MESNNKYWIKMNKPSSLDDTESHLLSELENFTVSEKQWLRANLNLVPFSSHIIQNRFISPENMDSYTHEQSEDQTDDFKTPVIMVRLGKEYWTLFKFKDDWYLLTDEEDEFYRCDGFKGLKKLLAELGLLK